ncbi:hypothetical protein [Neisseria lactamica]|uniref:hypothetical protein n=1 Tax=Neisseria lactamica TaxID=486 RepID=UPI000E58EE73|nr:hypothetical protein [Neisseria lactamica]
MADDRQFGIINLGGSGGETGTIGEMVFKLKAKSDKELVKHAQQIIKDVEAGNAQGVGLEQSAALQAIVYELALKFAGRLSGKALSKNDVAGFQKMTNLYTRLNGLHKQSSAWAYRVNNPVGKDSGLGRNDNRVQGRILRRGTSTAEGCFDEAL